MLSRQKQVSATLGINRNNTLALTYDMQNTSTKLILLNFSKSDDNRIRGHETIKESSILPKSIRSCYCLTESTPACACHHRDKNLSLFSKRHKTCHEDLNTLGMDTLPLPTKQIEKSSNFNRLPPCITKSENTVKINKKSKHKSSDSPNKYRKCNNRDLDILYSIPSLSHPDFTVGQRRVLMSLARIYTNLTPIKRSNSEFFKRENVSKVVQEKKSKDVSLKRNKRKTVYMRRDSLQTAVKTFGNENELLDSTDDEKTLNNDNKILSSSSSNLDEVLDEWLMNILRDQATYLSHESNNNKIESVIEENEKSEKYIGSMTLDEFGNENIIVNNCLINDSQLVRSKSSESLIREGEHSENLILDNLQYDEKKYEEENWDEIDKPNERESIENNILSERTLEKNEGNKKDQINEDRNDFSMDDQLISNNDLTLKEIENKENSFIEESIDKIVKLEQNEKDQKSEIFDRERSFTEESIDIIVKLEENQEDQKSEIFYGSSTDQINELKDIEGTFEIEESEITAICTSEQNKDQSISTAIDVDNETLEGIQDNVNLLRYISDELRQMMITK